MGAFLDTLAAGPVLFDGGMGTQLIARGMQAGESSERWCLDRAEDLEEIHRAYVAAGAEVITTNTFGATRDHLARHGLADRLEEINRGAVSIARRAADTGTWVAGDLGPTGLMFPPMGTADEAALYERYHEQARVLHDAGADLLLIETQVDLREAVAAVRAARDATDRPVGACMTFDAKPRGFFTLVGDRVEACCQALAEAGADFVGANCTLVPGPMVDLAAQLCEAATVPVLVQPNAGQPEVRGASIVYATSPEQFAEGMAAILETGVRAVGGCCGTDPETIGAVRRLLDARRP